MLTIEQIDRNLLNIDTDQLKDNFIAIAVQVDSHGIGYHSGLIISVNKEVSLFHYTGKDVMIDAPPKKGDWVLCKELDIIDEQFSLGFLAHCELIAENSNPTYGFMFENSYWKEGVYFSEAEVNEITTCVGFCISTISGYLLEDHLYLKLDEWNIDSTESFRQKYSSFYDRTLDKMKLDHPDKYDHFVLNYVKRITPSELAASAFIDKTPIDKEQINSILEKVEQSISNKRLNSA
ncbi:hypothetical protein [Olleya sp. Hel_I_94]|uniref:hypothetical protein n=1 Tax=Olleya sp. Hel_I_94 TaxID=1250001 RepID=UPI0011A8EA4E|nr:hypothetical protein [Olleya sp. Hel_I_94]TVZ47977.1 hypothetical protein JM82_2607 [Olleya sp. Hel_I_94]